MRTDLSLLENLQNLSFREECWENQWANGLWLDQVFRILSPLLIPGQKISTLYKTIELLCYDCEDLHIYLLSEEEPNHRPHVGNFLSDGRIYTLDISFKKMGMWIDGARSYRVGAVGFKRDSLWQCALERTHWLMNQIAPGEEFQEIVQRLKTSLNGEGGKDKKTIGLTESMGGHGIGISLHQGQDFIYSHPDYYLFSNRETLTVEPVFWRDIGPDRVFLYFEVTLFLQNGNRTYMPLAALEQD